MIDTVTKIFRIVPLLTNYLKENAMCSEVSFNDFSEVDSYFNTLVSESMSSDQNFHKFIFSKDNNIRLRKNITFAQAIGSSSIEAKVKKIAPMKFGGSGEVGVDISWGGKDGVEVSGHAKGEVHDKKGNYAEVKAEQNSDGTGKVSASGGRKDD
jgi:hypothetical protein